MTNTKVKSLDDLVKGIKQLLSESRCSFSDKDRALLNDALVALEDAREKRNQLLVNPLLVTKAMKLILEFLLADNM